jgi:uncharacterized repeat protein (TIGR03803 family)
VIADEKGNLYGTTAGGGVNSCDNVTTGCGTVFQLSPPIGRQAQWNERVLWSFGASGDGKDPTGSLASNRGISTARLIPAAQI